MGSKGTLITNILRLHRNGLYIWSITEGPRHIAVSSKCYDTEEEALSDLDYFLSKIYEACLRVSEHGDLLPKQTGPTPPRPELG